MDTHSDDRMVALLPITSDWCRQALPHLTLVYNDGVSEMRPTAFQELAKTVAELAMKYEPLTLMTYSLEVFGEEEKVDVYRLRLTPELLEMRAALSYWDKGTYPVYNPHVTIGPVGSANPIAPYYIAFNRLYLSFGDSNMTFWLKNAQGVTNESDNVPSQAVAV